MKMSKRCELILSISQLLHSWHYYNYKSKRHEENCDYVLYSRWAVFFKQKCLIFYIIFSIRFKLFTALYYQL